MKTKTKNSASAEGLHTVANCDNGSDKNTLLSMEEDIHMISSYSTLEEPYADFSAAEAELLLSIGGYAPYLPPEDYCKIPIPFIDMDNGAQEIIKEAIDEKDKPMAQTWNNQEIDSDCTVDEIQRMLIHI